MIPGEHVISDPAAIQSEPAAPHLPIEGPIVGAALAAKEAHTQLMLLGWLIANSPRNEVVVCDTFTKAQQHLNEAWAQYSAYREVFTCKGQA